MSLVYEAGGTWLTVEYFAAAEDAGAAVALLDPP